MERFGNEVRDRQDISDTLKKELLEVVLRDIIVEYDHTQKVHILTINFNIPVLLRDGNEGQELTRVMITPPKSGRKSLKPNSTLPYYSTVTESRQPSQQNEYSEGLRYFLALSIEFNVTDLWVPHYSQHQQFLFDTISKFRAEGWSYKKISKWFNEQNILTPRGKQFIPPSVFSIIKKKKISNDRFNRTFQPTINKADIKIQNSNPTNFE